MERAGTENNSIFKQKYNFAELIDSIKLKTSITTYAPNYIHEIACSGDVASMQEAIDKGLKIDTPDEIGRYPIHEAAANGHLEMVELLLQNGANIDARINPFGHTALYIAVEKGYHDIAKFLIQSNARLYVADRLTGRGLLHIAAKKNDNKMAVMLVDAGINTLLCDRQELTARDIAALNNNKELEKFLLKAMQHHAMLLEI